VGGSVCERVEYYLDVGAKKKQVRVGAVNLPAVTAHLEDIFHQSMPVLHGERVGEVEKGSSALPPVNGLAVIEKVAVVKRVLVVWRIHVDHPGNPVGDLQAQVMEVLVHPSRVRKRGGVIHEGVPAGLPGAVDVQHPNLQDEEDRSGSSLSNITSGGGGG